MGHKITQRPLLRYKVSVQNFHKDKVSSGNETQTEMTARKGSSINLN